MANLKCYEGGNVLWVCSITLFVRFIPHSSPPSSKQRRWRRPKHWAPVFKTALYNTVDAGYTHRLYTNYKQTQLTYFPHFLFTMKTIKVIWKYRSCKIRISRLCNEVWCHCLCSVCISVSVVMWSCCFQLHVITSTGRHSGRKSAAFVSLLTYSL